MNRFSVTPISFASFANAARTRFVVCAAGKVTVREANSLHETLLRRHAWQIPNFANEKIESFYE
jgi:hypothetical protein